MSEVGERKEIALPAGTIRYRETGEGRPVVFVHGYLVDGRIWDGVVDRLGARFRCLAPDWPLGAQRLPMHADADLTPYGIASLISSFLDALELEDVTLVGNDTGGAMCQITVTRHPQRFARLVLTNCDTHDNFPPGAYKAMPLIARLPGGMAAMAAPFRFEAFARAVFRPFSRKTIPPELAASWLQASRGDPGLRRDLKKVTAGIDKRYTNEAAERLRGSQLPILLLWAPGDRYFPLSYAERLASEAGNARIVRIDDAKTFVPWDQPQAVADRIAEFADSQKTGI